ncbi:pro-Pol polyprotein [Trichonephila clavata]|uniref:Pro-Pol polyprotein n=1 Tax=Trichonephila clavata TaxID=2740835 RepID=A0A8X6H679_TRICU|nr:pro-Pol polyprotein [Trichonephila clavata]
MDFTCKALNYTISQAQFYTDSIIVLSWIGSHASRWKTFVANRVAKIQTLSSATQWHHISGSVNPADLATRGVSSSTLLNSIWLCGPKFLHETFPFQTDSCVPALNDAVPEERDIAVHRLQQIERRFSKNQSLSDQYHKFLDDYLKLGHMELIPENEIDVPASSSFYLPHHPVPNKNGGKFRVVFDGSAKSSSGISLNDKLMVGPQLQTDLTTLLLRFRMHKIAITADIEKMYRQITLHDSDFQRIVWRNSPFEPIQDFRLTRIAYGTASAPYLAIKCLQQLALNESNNFPLASEAALKDFYVDDLMSGANSLSEALELQNQLTQMVSSAGLVLRKWASNCSELLNSIDSDMRLSNTSLNIDNDDTVKTLGILWHPASDVFYFKITPLSFEGTLTKRTLLSTIAKTFDPLGWLSPITIQYKTIMQRLWKQPLKWDERVPTDIKLEWEQLVNDVQFVKDIKIPRFLLVDSDNLFHLFGFSDASEKAYAAAMYCRSVSDTGKINVQLNNSQDKSCPTENCLTSSTRILRSSFVS